MINSLDRKEYIEWVDFKYDIVDAKLTGYTRHELFFRDNDWNLIAYVKLHIDSNNNKAYVIDITNSNWFKHFSDNFKEFYLKNWYKLWVALMGFWWVALDKSLKIIKEKYPEIDIVLVNSLTTNREIVCKLVDRVQKQADSIIKNVTWWNVIATCTVFI